MANNNSSSTVTRLPSHNNNNNNNNNNTAAAVLAAAAAAAFLQALASLLQEQAGKDVMVSAGGVPLLVHGLDHPDADVTAYCSEMLARLSSSSAAQAAIRCVIRSVHNCIYLWSRRTCNHTLCNRNASAHSSSWRLNLPLATLHELSISSCCAAAVVLKPVPACCCTALSLPPRCQPSNPAGRLGVCR
jgi:hypothetical protein